MTTGKETEEAAAWDDDYMTCLLGMVEHKSQVFDMAFCLKYNVSENMKRKFPLQLHFIVQEIRLTIMEGDQDESKRNEPG